MTDFVHCHVHSAYSLLDSTVRIGSLVDKAKEDGQKAIALTDHGTLAGVPKFVDKCNKEGLKPIIGQEFYVAVDSRFRYHYNRIQVGVTAEGKPRMKDQMSSTHLILLAKTAKGWDNLRTLSTLAYTEGFYKKPRIDHELLARYSEGLIATTACMGGDISAHLIRGLSNEEGEGKTEYDPNRAQAKLNWYVSHFGDDFYIELQDHGPDSTQAAINEWYRNLYPPEMFIASADCHYLNAEDYDLHDTMLCCNVVAAKNDPDRWRFPTDQCWLKTGEEMAELFYPHEIANTVALADKIDFELPLRKQWFMPNVPLDVLDGGTVSVVDMFRHRCIVGLLTRLGLCTNDEEFAPVMYEQIAGGKYKAYQDRLNYEMDIFVKADFAEYALILWDLMDMCKHENIMTGDGRGSGAGSLVLYTLGITNVDPILRQCPFERFINPGRLENFAPPDVDLDFPQSRRKDIILYLRKRYGEDRVCQIGTYANLGAAGVVKKLAIPLGIDGSTAARITNLIPQGEGGTAQGSGAASEEQGMSLDDVYRQSEAFRKEIQKMTGSYGSSTGEWLMHFARGLRGLGDHASTHASGVLITKIPVADILPLMVAKVRQEKELVLAQFDMFDVEKMGVLKFDMLGLATLDALAYTQRMIQENIDVEFSFETIPMDDPKAFDLLSSGKTVGIFQAEGGGLGRLIPQVKPRTIAELAMLNSLCRPGPMGDPSGTPTYIKRRTGAEPVSYLFPELEPILHESLGVVCYQEHIMEIAHKLAGFTLAEADYLRSVMGKKKISEMPKYQRQFVDGLVMNSGIAIEKAERLWEILLPMSQYVFNKSHATAYSYTTYKCAYAKAHYPAYFIAGTMTAELTKSGGGDALPALVRDALGANCVIKAPDVNLSEAGPTALDFNTIILGLTSVKGCGENSARAILEERNAHGPFTSLEEFQFRVAARKCNAAVVAALIEAGTFDSIEGTSHKNSAERSQQEFTLFGFYLSAHVCAQKRDEWLIEQPNLVPIANVLDDWRMVEGVRFWGGKRKTVKEYPEKRIRAVVSKVAAKRSKKPPHNQYLMMELEDETGVIGCTLFSNSLERFSVGSEENPAIKKGDILDLIGRKSERYEGSFDVTSYLLNLGR